MALVLKSLNAVSTLGPGHEARFDTPKMNVSMQVSITGAPLNVAVNLEITVDGQNFVGIGAFTSNSGHAAVGGIARFPVSGPFVGARASLAALDDPSATISATIAVA